MLIYFVTGECSSLYLCYEIMKELCANRKKNKKYKKNHPEKVRQFNKTYNTKHRDVISSKKKEYNLKMKNQEFGKRFMKFKEATIDGAAYVCNCCRRLLFKTGIVFEKLFILLFEFLISFKFIHIRHPRQSSIEQRKSTQNDWRLWPWSYHVCYSKYCIQRHWFLHGLCLLKSMTVICTAIDFKIHITTRIAQMMHAISVNRL